jgi:hypothetical protein
LLFNHSTGAGPSRPGFGAYAAWVDSTDVTAAQASELAGRVAQMSGFLTRLRDRMQKRAWAANDPLYNDVKAAQDTVHRLHLTLRELERLQRSASRERRPWEPGGSGREGP